MSSHILQKTINSLVICDIKTLAPRMHEMTLHGLDECERAGIDLVLHETRRVNALQEIYFKTGASRAKTIYNSYHGYDLAFDGKSKKHAWAVDADYWKLANSIFSTYGLVWGGIFKSIPDPGHWQWTSLRDRWISPSKEMIDLLKAEHKQEVWQLVGAM